MINPKVTLARKNTVRNLDEVREKPWLIWKSLFSSGNSLHKSSYYAKSSCMVCVLSHWINYLTLVMFLRHDAWLLWLFSHSESIIFTNCASKVLFFYHTHCQSFHSFPNPYFPSVSRRTLLTHSCTPINHAFEKHSKHTPSLTLMHADDTWYFSGPLCACSISISFSLPSFPLLNSADSLHTFIILQAGPAVCL